MGGSRMTDDIPKTTGAADEAALAGQGQRSPCPICSRPSDAEFRPFCSKRCADIDLHRWFSGTYAIPATEVEANGLEDSETE